MLGEVNIRTLLICLMAILAVMYGIAWFAPAIGLAYNDGAFLMMAVNHGGSGSPPLFPVLLALFAAISRQAQWLKLAPLGCTFCWLALTKRLLEKMGATQDSAWIMTAMTAASPAVLYLATGLFAEPLFAALATACLLTLLDEKPAAAGLCAGLASITLPGGATIIAACLLTLVATRRLRSAAVFTGIAGLFAAPWLGWELANGGMPAASLHLSEMGVLLGNNAMLLAASPFTLLTGWSSLYPGLLTAAALLIALIRRRHFIPDLFLGFYCLMLLWRTEPPLHAFAPVLPLFLWMIWRAARSSRFAAAAKVAVVPMIACALCFSAARISTAAKLGAVTAETAAPDNWHEMEKLFAFIRANTPPDAVLLADLNPVFELKTGRKTLRGFTADGYRSYYAPPGSLVTPDELRAALLREQVSYVALTPDRDLPESASFHRAVAALERGGILEPVSVPGAASEYRLLHVAGAR